MDKTRPLLKGMGWGSGGWTRCGIMHQESNHGVIAGSDSKREYIEIENGSEKFRR